MRLCIAFDLIFKLNCRCCVGFESARRVEEGNGRQRFEWGSHGRGKTSISC